MLQTDQSTTAETTFFQRELLRLGPDGPPTAWSRSQAADYCRHWARGSYENFTVASCLLPRKLRQDFYNIYTFCRWSDNLADEIPEASESLRLLGWWQQQLALCTSGRPWHPVLVALQETIDKHALPLQPFYDLLTAFRQDQQQNRYQNETELGEYCQRSANPVGRILLHLAGASSEENARLSDHICTALQLANFCQDLAPDAARGRIYAPRSLWVKHGVTEGQFLNRQPTAELRHLLADWTQTTRRRFNAGWPLVRLVPAWLATDVDLFVRGGMAVLDAIERQDYDVWSTRPRISKLKKLSLLGRSLFERSMPGRLLHRRSVADA